MVGACRNMDRACELEIVNTSLGGADQIIGQGGVIRVELPSDLDSAWCLMNTVFRGAPLSVSPLRGPAAPQSVCHGW